MMRHLMETVGKYVSAISSLLSESVGDFPTVSFEELWHVGSMNAQNKGKDSYEGGGLSVSLHPSTWRRIARGMVSGETWLLTKPRNSFLDFHKLSRGQKAEIAQWGVELGYVEQTSLWNLKWWDDEYETFRSFDLATREEAEAEMEGQDSMEITEVKNGLRSTPKLDAASHQSRQVIGEMTLDLLSPLWAEAQGLDGVWWEDNYDPSALSAPRGVIAPSKVGSWLIKKVDPNHEDLDESVEQSPHDGNAALLHYFSVRPCPVGTGDEFWDEVWGAFIEWLNPDNIERLTKFLGVEEDEIHPGHYHELPDKAKQMFAKFVEDHGYARQIQFDDPKNAPSWVALEPVSHSLLPDSTWLLHFTDHYNAISKHGFAVGAPDIDKLSLTIDNTIWGATTRSQSASPGYNFAYLADGSVDLDLRSKPGIAGFYGSGAVLFQNTGILCYHYGDKERQVIFYGPDANRASIIPIAAGGRGWIAPNGKSSKSIARLVKELIKGR